MALPDDASKPLEISADAVEIDEGQHTSIYIGKVQMQQGSMHLWADHVTVYHQVSRQPERIIALGKPARYEQTEQEGGVIHAEALNMVYHVVKDEIFLTDQALFTRGKDSFKSDRIVYDRKTGVVKGGASAKGNQRVHISIFPNSGTVKPTPDTKPAPVEIIPPKTTTATKITGYKASDYKPDNKKVDTINSNSATTQPVVTVPADTVPTTNSTPSTTKIKPTKRKRRPKVSIDQ